MSDWDSWTPKNKKEYISTDSLHEAILENRD